MFLRGIFCLILIFTFCFNQLSKSQTTSQESLNQETKKAVISRINELVVEKYIFLDKAEEIKQYLSKKLLNGEYAKITKGSDFAGTLERDIRDISNDGHFRIEFNPDKAKQILASKNLNEEMIEKEKKALYQELQQQNFGVFKVERLGGNIGYLDLRRFTPCEIEVETIISAMNLLANSSAVIIDLRKNIGGDPKMVQLIESYFLKKRTHLNSLIYRYKQNSEEQYWSFPYVPGKNLYDKDLYILTSNFTFSGGEDLAYTMKHLNRAIIIGEKTRGGAHEGDYEAILDKFVMFLPMGKTVNPITKSNWEGTGVEPDIEVPQQKALDRAQLIILEKLFQNKKNERNKEIIIFALNEIKGRLQPAKVDSLILKKYAGTYGRRSKRKVIFENGDLTYTHGNSSYKLVPISDVLFYVDGADDFQIEFSIKMDGSIEKLIIVWDDGFKSHISRIE